MLHLVPTVRCLTRIAETLDQFSTAEKGLLRDTIRTQSESSAVSVNVGPASVTPEQ